MWQRQFRRKKEQIDNAGWFKRMLDITGREAIKKRLETEGPLSTHAFDTKVTGPKEMWTRPPHKLALDYMWYAGELATCHRQNFTKFYDLAERIFPKHLRDQSHSDEAQIDWLCTSALDRIGFGTLGEIQKFWEATTSQEVKAWADRAQHSLVPVELQSADGTWNATVAFPDIEQRLANISTPTSRLRILNPFDPAIRDRNRLMRLFGFDYRVEMFVPAAKRRWGYYVYPLLEGNRFVGRIEVKADRAKGTLDVINLWSEAKVKWTTQRSAKLDAELDRLARFVSCKTVNWACQKYP